MRIGGLQKFSLIDYPDKMSCVIFTQGCNFRCRYCHNPELVVPQDFCPEISEEEVFTFLETRRKYLEGVVITGGEPTIQKDLCSFLKKIKKMSFLVKLDTNGSQPKFLKQLMNQKLVDFIAMDVKAPIDSYEEIVDVRFDVDTIRKSIDLIIHSGIAHEFRTTVVPSLCSESDLCEIRRMIHGDQSYRLQRVRFNQKMLDKSLLDL